MRNTMVIGAVASNEDYELDTGNLFRNPGEAGLTAAERAYLSEGDPAEAPRPVTFADWRRLFAYRTTWGMVIGNFGSIYMVWLYTAWMPGYLEIERHFSLGKTGLIGAIPFAFGMVGSLVGGRAVDALARRGVDPIRARKIPMAASLTGCALFTAVAALVPSDALAIACMSAALFLVNVCSTSVWAMASVAAPANCTASIGSVQNFGGYIGGALAPTVTAYIKAGTGAFAPAFLAGAAIAVAAAAVYWTLIREPIPAAAGARGALGGLRPAE